MPTQSSDATNAKIERLCMALLTPMIESMFAAGIDRISIEKDGSTVVQFQDGAVMGPLKRIPTPTQEALGTLIAWLPELGEASKKALFQKLEA